MRAAGNGVVQWFMALIAALQFLTRLPIPVATPNSDAVFRRSAVFFPAAGLLIGGIVAAAAYGFGFIFPSYVSAVLVLAVWVFLSGGLHLDGLMDTADGLLSHRSRERMLEIMKDSRVGAMGVIVGVLYLLLKAMLLIAVIGAEGFERFFTFGVLALIPVWSRAFMATAIAGWPYAREGQGLGQLFRSVGGRHAVGAGLLAAGSSAVVLGIAAFGGFAGFDRMALMMVGAAALTYLSGTWIASSVSRKLGGLTGDVYGALNEMLELILLMAFVACMRYWSGV